MEKEYLMITYKYPFYMGPDNLFRHEYKRYADDFTFKMDLEKLKKDKYVSEIKTYRITEI